MKGSLVKMIYPKIIHWNYFETSKCLNIVYVEDKATEKEIKRLGFIPYMFKQVLLLKKYKSSLLKI